MNLPTIKPNVKPNKIKPFKKKRRRLIPEKWPETHPGPKPKA